MTTSRARGVSYSRAPSADDVVWQLRGECVHYDPDVFQPANEIGARMAKQICRTCPVVEQCGEWALAKGETVGVWGAMSERDRRDIWTGRRSA